MRGGLVIGRGRLGPVGFHEHEPAGVILLLHHVEAGHSGFPQRGFGIGAGRGDEVGDRFGFHLDEDMDDEHENRFREGFQREMRRLRAWTVQVLVARPFSASQTSWCKATVGHTCQGRE